MPLLGFATILLLLLALVRVAPQVLAQSGAVLAIDPDPAGNEAGSLGDIDGCRSVATGDEFQVDIVVEDVEDLLAYQLYVSWDAPLLELKDRDVDLFLGANDGSNVFDTSSRLPSGPPYSLSAVDLADPLAPDSGSGVLARLTFEAVAPGEATLTFAQVDYDGDGAPDLASFLKNTDGDVIGSEDEDIYFDGETREAVVVIGEPCTGQGPILEEEESSGTDWLPFAAAAGTSGAALLMIVAGILAIRRKNARDM